MKDPTKRHLNSLEVIELLTLLKTESHTTIAAHMDISVQTVRFYKRKYCADSPQRIDQIVAQLYRESNEYMGIDYEQQEICIPKKLYFKCHTCQFSASENNIQGILDHLGRHRSIEKKLLTEQTI